MHDEPTTAPSSALGPHGVGVRLALEAGEGGDWKPVIDWLARNPCHAVALAEFLAAQRGLEAVLASHAGPPPIAGLELKEVIGRGGMGVVYRAYDPQLKRDVAVKCVLAGGDLGRFRFEAETIASLDHPNVVRIHAFGEAAGQPYLVMPLLEGSLTDHVKRQVTDGSLPPREAARIVRDVALGVHHAHQHGLIHRDLKPGNVLLDRDGAPLVADFGLARRADASGSGGGVAGTLAYAAPEQARGDRVLTSAIDVHALGAILFELLTGATPFGGGDPISVLRRVQEEPAPLVRSRRAEAPADLEEICQRCLAKHPEDRYPSALEMAHDLTRYLSGEPIGRRTGRWWSDVLRGIRKRREVEFLGTQTMNVPLWGAASVVLGMAGLQAAVLLSQTWLAWVAVGYYLLAWMGILWLFPIRSWGRLNSVERNSTLVQMGMVLGCTTCLPGAAWPGGDVVRALPAFLAIKGLGVFAHGQWYWGWMYVAGAAYFAAAALLPLLVPTEAWPAVFGLCSGSFQVWAALHLRRAHRDSGTA